MARWKALCISSWGHHRKCWIIHLKWDILAMTDFCSGSNLCQKMQSKIGLISVNPRQSSRKWVWPDLDFPLLHLHCWMTQTLFSMCIIKLIQFPQRLEGCGRAGRVGRGQYQQWKNFAHRTLFAFTWPERKSDGTTMELPGSHGSL